MAGRRRRPAALLEGGTCRGWHRACGPGTAGLADRRTGRGRGGRDPRGSRRLQLQRRPRLRRTRRGDADAVTRARDRRGRGRRGSRSRSLHRHGCHRHRKRDGGITRRWICNAPPDPCGSRHSPPPIALRRRRDGAGHCRPHGGARLRPSRATCRRPAWEARRGVARDRREWRSRHAGGGDARGGRSQGGGLFQEARCAGAADEARGGRGAPSRSSRRPILQVAREGPLGGRGRNGRRPIAGRCAALRPNGWRGGSDRHGGGRRPGDDGASLHPARHNARRHRCGYAADAG